MTNDEKAKAYDEALEDMRVIYPNLKGDAKLAVEHAFPQLREINEAEIRKDIIGGLMWQRDNLESEGPHDNNLILPGFCLTVGEQLAYLEKQKEQPISAEEVLARAGLKPYKDGNQWCILAGDNIQEGICGFGDTIEDALYEFLKEVLDLQKEQKPAEWSEEDEKMVRFYENDYDNNLGNMPMWDVIENRIKFKGWLVNKLKFLRPSWKPNEQEKGALRTAIHILTDERSFPKAAAQLQNILNAFEGKESRKDWKPSEEQMKALEDVITMKRAVNEVATETLRELIEQLKKL